MPAGSSTPAQITSGFPGTTGTGHRMQEVAEPHRNPARDSFLRYTRRPEPAKGFEGALRKSGGPPCTVAPVVEGSSSQSM